jgi:hypothetical protein
MENLEQLQEVRNLNDENTNLKNQNIGIVAENHNIIQRNLALLNDNEQLIQENNDSKTRIIEVENEIDRLIKQINELKNKDKENDALLSINKKLLEDCEYYKLAAYNSYVETVDNFVFGILDIFLNLVPSSLSDSRIIQILKKNHYINMMLDLLKIFNLNPKKYIKIIYEKFIRQILLIPFWLSNYMWYRKIENIYLNYLSIVFFVYLINYISTKTYICTLLPL